MTASATSLQCPQCQQTVSVGSLLPGEQAFCAGCGRSLLVPEQPENEATVRSEPVNVRGDGARPIAPGHPGGDRVWRDGDRLVMDRAGQLPPVCVLTNEPAHTRLQCRVSWSHPALYLLLLLPGVGLVLILLLISALSRRVWIEVGLCESCLRRRRRRLIGAWLWAFAGAVMIAGGLAITWLEVNVSPVWTGLLYLAGVTVLSVAALVGQRVSQVVQAERITEAHLWLTGIHPGLLYTLEEFGEK